jgi:predicted MPP superfamily phosphohydrolase
MEKYVRYPHHKEPKNFRKYPTDSKWLNDFEQADGYKILLSHHPEYWILREPMLRDRKIDLVLSGHAHGGQWHFWGRGIYSPGQGLLPKYTSGIHQGPYGSMIVSRGLSNPYRTIPRLGNPCEAVYVQFV